MKLNTKLKKMTGENLAKFLALNFNQEALVPLLSKKFNNEGKDLRNMSEDDYDLLKTYINEKLISSFEEKEEEKEVLNAYDLLKSVGYTLTKCTSFEDILSFKKYFRSGEELCKFNDNNRHKNYNVFFIVKDNAESIEPLDEPSKTDCYSTSVCSIQVSKDGKNVTQITSRYNHNVSGCDNTFNSNLENICSGLTDSFNKEFDFKIGKYNNSSDFKNFVFFDGVYVYYNREINGMKIGNNCTVTDKINRYDPNYYYIWDYFIINLKTCKIEWNDTDYGYHDAFVDVFNNSVKKIEFVKNIDEVDDNDSDEVCYIEK